MIISLEERRTTAYHEAGHALVAKLLPGADPVHKVTIIPRGMALGLTQQVPIDDRHSVTKDWVLTRPLHHVRRPCGGGADPLAAHAPERATTSSAPRTWRARWCASGA